MSSGTGENEVELRKMLDFTRLAAVIVLLLHFYYSCYAAFKQWKLTATITDRLLHNIEHTGLFKELYITKLVALGLLVISLMGAKGRKDEKLQLKYAVLWVVTGLLFYFLSSVLFKLDVAAATIAISYMAITGGGFLCILTGGLC